MPRKMLLYLRMRCILHYCTREELDNGLSNDWPVIVMSTDTTRATEAIRDVVNDIFHDWQLSHVIYVLLSRKPPRTLDVSRDTRLSKLQTILQYWIYDAALENASFIKCFWNNFRISNKLVNSAYRIVKKTKTDSNCVHSVLHSRSSSV
ncbi:uncharacterized protein LOC128551232 [Mercenaria mercenaria]|uniref:uncharacterized protein LOC128551232 n=1 Tax=Mercenaria mercenaria TaxID=6596 RepID=UPI00234EEFAE|nr:uncharacterized protein LOC128551232 [Mercenaria mercenaria]